MKILTKPLIVKIFRENFASTNLKNLVMQSSPMKNKKGVQTTLMWLIIILLVAIVLFVWGSDLIKITGAVTNKELCQTSVLMKAIEPVRKITGTESPILLDCYTNNIKINNDGIYLRPDNKKKEILDISFSGRSLEDRNNDIKRYLANQLYDCWDQFLQGKEDFLSRYDPGGSDVRCFPCAVITFQEPFLEKFKYGEWDKYLSEEKLKNGMSYKKYLSGENEIYNDVYKNNILDSKKGGSLSIYLIAFKTNRFKDYAKQHPLLTSMSAALPPPFNAFAIIAPTQPFTTKFISSVYLLNTEDLANKCDQLY